jgi:hypothetical protein
MVFSPRVVPIGGFDFGARGGTNGAADLLVTAIYLFYSSPAILTINLEKMAHLPFQGARLESLKQRLTDTVELRRYGQTAPKSI